MKINSVASTPAQPVMKIDLPMLLISNRNRMILLALRSAKYYTGIEVYSGNGGYNSVGEYSETWAKDAFDPYYGEVTIGNQIKD